LSFIVLNTVNLTSNNFFQRLK